MRALTDTIVAPITAVGGAVAVVRLSGPDAFDVARRVFPALPDPPESHRALYGRFTTGDDGLALCFASGRSYTGEPTVELSGHGSPAAVRTLVEACVEQGARRAQPGEFTLRAFLNGRMDLTQAEGVRASVEALTSAQLRAASRLRDGALRDRVRAVSARVRGLLAAVEAATEFEEETGPLDASRFSSMAREGVREIHALLRTQRSARVVRQGLTVVLAGAPNAGKSSLFNAVLGTDRAIVTPIPGTTRDALEETLEVDGFLVRLVDTAGLRESDDPVERLGVARSREALEAADVVWWVVDGAGLTASGSSPGLGGEPSAGPGSGELPEAVSRRARAVASKADLLSPGQRADVALRGYRVVSAKTGEGLDALLDDLRALAHIDGASEPAIEPRHAGPLAEARDALRRARATVRAGLPTDLAAVDLLAALHALGTITGETADAGLLERIFADFCIGK